MFGRTLIRHASKTTVMLLALVTVASGTAFAQQSTFNCLTPSRQATARIVGGQSATYNQFPWQVSIGIRGRDAYDGHFCGGVLIGARWVLTAGHCVQGQASDPANLHIVHGVTNLRSEQGNMYNVERIVPHPDYNNDDVGQGNDIALIKLDRAASAGRGAYALLPQASIARNFVFPEACAVVTGWGTTRPEDQAPNTMQAVAMPIISNEECRRAYGVHGFSPDAIPDSDVCAGFLQGGVDSCQGDSGGPLVVEGGPKGFVLAGIVSRGGYDNPTGFWCALEEGYGIYTRVESFVPWIVQTIRDN